MFRTLRPRFARRDRLTPWGRTIAFRPGLMRLEERETPASFTVTNFNDSGNGSLRQAIIDVNNHADATSTIDATGIAGSPGIIPLASQLPAINKNLTITADGPGDFQVNRVSPFPLQYYRIFEVNAGKTVTLTGIEMSNGDVVNANGGGILNKGNLTLNNCAVVSNRTSTSGLGGGIYNHFGASLFINDSEVSSNNAAEDGGGIMNYGVLEIDDSTLDDNEAAGDGGGIFNSSLGDSCEIRGGSTLSNNVARFGGGIANWGGYLTVADSWIEYNRASEDGGGISTRGAVGGASVCWLDTVVIRYNYLTGDGDGDGVWYDGNSNYDTVNCTFTDDDEYEGSV